MDCREFEKRIPEFLNREMNFLALRKFVAHMENCPDCKEELTIQFLIGEGLVRLEEGNAFDLKTELFFRVEEAEKKIRFHIFFLRIGMVVEVLIMLGIAAAVFAIITS